MKYFKLFIAILTAVCLSGCGSLKGGAAGLFNQYTDNNKEDFSAIERVDLVQLLDPLNYGCEKEKISNCEKGSLSDGDYSVLRLERAFAGFYDEKYKNILQLKSEDRRNRVQDRIIAASNRLLKYPTQKCGTLHGTFDFHATLSHSELPALFEVDFIGLSLVFPHFPRLTLSAHGFAPACAYA